MICFQLGPVEIFERSDNLSSTVTKQEIQFHGAFTCHYFKIVKWIRLRIINSQPSHLANVGFCIVCTCTPFFTRWFVNEISYKFHWNWTSVTTSNRDICRWPYKCLCFSTTFKLNELNYIFGFSLYIKIFYVFLIN